MVLTISGIVDLVLMVEPITLLAFCPVVESELKGIEGVDEPVGGILVVNELSVDDIIVLIKSDNVDSVEDFEGNIDVTPDVGILVVFNFVGVVVVVVVVVSFVTMPVCVVFIGEAVLSSGNPDTVLEAKLVDLKVLEDRDTES